MCRSKLLWTSTIIIFAASILNVTLHESGHYIAAILFDASDVELHHNYVAYDSDSIGFWERIVVAASGPLLSLIIGIIGLWWHTSIKVKGWKSLFLLWLAYHGLLNFMGYVLIAPVFTYGDTGFIFSQLEFPLWSMILLSVTSFVLMFFVFDRGGKRFQPYFENEVDSRQ